MNLFEVLVISVGLSLDVFAYVLYKGAMISRIDKREPVQIMWYIWQLAGRCDSGGQSDYGGAGDSADTYTHGNSVADPISSYFCGNWNLYADQGSTQGECIRA